MLATDSLSRLHCRPASVVITARRQEVSRNSLSAGVVMTDRLPSQKANATTFQRTSLDALGRFLDIMMGLGLRAHSY